MGEHTKLPWTVSPARTVENTAMIVGGEGFEFGLIADVTEDSDAAFIVKAVNNHEALVEALLKIRETAAGGADRRTIVAQIFDIATRASRLEFESADAPVTRPVAGRQQT